VGYALLTALRNEAEGLERLVASVAAQSVRPDPWILVENGSTDGTLELLAAIGKTTPWVRVASSEPDPRRERGASIVRALHVGLDALGPPPPAVAVLDADVTLPSEYFERLLETLDASPRLGLAGGTCYELENDTWRARRTTAPFVWGAARVYRRECLQAVLPLEPRTGWDAVDVAAANALGWETRTLPDLAFFHHRPEHSRERRRWEAWADQGRISHYLGYRPSYLALRALARGMRDPAAFGLVGGYAASALRRSPRCTRPGVRDWVRTEQRLRRLARRVAEARGGDADDGRQSV